MTTLTQRHYLLWIGLLINMLPVSLCMLGFIDVFQAGKATDIVWMPSIIIMILSFDFKSITLLMVIKAMALACGERFVPFYIWTRDPLATTVIVLAVAAISAYISALLKQHTAP
jgi:hypothetical protein